jgi:uncharacterized protein
VETSAGVVGCGIWLVMGAASCAAGGIAPVGSLALALVAGGVERRGSGSNLPLVGDAERVEVADAPERERYELSVDDEVVAFIAYRMRPGIIALIHTEVDEAFQHRGLGEELIRSALRDTRARGLAVLPFCPFVKAFIEGHREFEDLVPEARRAQFGL